MCTGYFYMGFGSPLIDLNYIVNVFYRNSEKWTFLMSKILKNSPFLIVLRRMLKSGFFYCVKMVR